MPIVLHAGSMSSPDFALLSRQCERAGNTPADSIGTFLECPHGASIRVRYIEGRVPSLLARTIGIKQRQW